MTKAEKAAYMRKWRKPHAKRINEKRNSKYRAVHPPRTDVVRGAARMKRFRAKHMERLNVLKNHPCLDCKGTFPPECMDFDHVHGKKSFNVSKMVGRSLDTFYTEVAKCELVCSNCHRIRTRKRQQYVV